MKWDSRDYKRSGAEDNGGWCKAQNIEANFPSLPGVFVFVDKQGNVSLVGVSVRNNLCATAASARDNSKAPSELAKATYIQTRDQTRARAIAKYLRGRYDPWLND